MFPPETQQVRSDCSLEERASKIKGMIAKHKDAIHTTLFQAKLIGEELWQAKDQCISEGKEWYEWLDKQDIEPRWATKRMRIAEYWTDVVGHRLYQTDTGVDEALNLISETAPETKKTTKKKAKIVVDEKRELVQQVNKKFQSFAREVDGLKDEFGVEGHREVRKAFSEAYLVWLRWSEQDPSQVLEYADEAE